MNHGNDKFPGFPPEPVTNYWPYPKALNGWWHALTPTEQKVLDYILRHTWGYKKTADAISLSQFADGIVKRDGTVIDKGTGIKDERTIRKALKGLVTKNFIEKTGQLGRETIFKLCITPSQEVILLPYNNTSHTTKNVTTTPTQKLSPTIKDISINDNNNIPASPDSHKISSKEEITSLISYLSIKLGVKFPNYGKQARYVSQMLLAGYNKDDVTWAIDQMYGDKWWAEHSFDMKNVADEIPKLMTRTFKKEGVK